MYRRRGSALLAASCFAQDPISKGGGALLAARCQFDNASRNYIFGSFVAFDFQRFANVIQRYGHRCDIRLVESSPLQGNDWTHGPRSSVGNTSWSTTLSVTGAWVDAAGDALT
jgi:hypothetical protein